MVSNVSGYLAMAFYSIGPDISKDLQTVGFMRLYIRRPFISQTSANDIDCHGPPTVQLSVLFSLFQPSVIRVLGPQFFDLRVLGPHFSILGFRPVFGLGSVSVIGDETNIHICSSNSIYIFTCLYLMKLSRNVFFIYAVQILYLHIYISPL